MSFIGDAVSGAANGLGISPLEFLIPPVAALHATGNALGITNGGGLLDTSNNYNAYAPQLNTQNFNAPIQQGQESFNNNQSSQNQLAQALLAQSQGQGPNPAQAMLQQQTDKNNREAAGLVASQRGVNPGMAARVAAQNSTMANQAAAGQGATMQAQQQLAAQQGLGSTLGTIGTQQLQNQQILQNANAAQNSAINTGVLGAQGLNQSTAAGNAANKAQIIGGLLGGAGAVGAAAVNKGGRIKGKANVEGDSIHNDTVPAMLSPGEIVVPRTKAEDPDKAKEFIDQLMKSKGKSEPKTKSYGDVLAAHKKLQERMDALEKKMGKGA